MVKKVHHPHPCHHLLLRKGARPSIVGGVWVTLVFSLVRICFFTFFKFIYYFIILLGERGGGALAAGTGKCTGQ